MRIAPLGRFGFVLVACFSVLPNQIALSAEVPSNDYKTRWDWFAKLDHGARKVPKIPPKDKRLRVIIDSDTATEIDDVWAVGLALTAPERFSIEGLVGVNFDDADGGPSSIDQSVALIKTIMDKAGLADRYPVKRGSPPMRYYYEPSRSEGVDFIIERAMAGTPDDPLWVIGLGAATDIASAYLIEPRIADRVVAFQHFRTKWPKQCHNFNVFNDPRAARVVFHSNLPFVLFDTGTYLTCPMEESQRFVECGPLGKFLHEYRFRSAWYQSPKKGFYDLGDIVSLLDPDLASWEETACPDVEQNLDYAFRGTKGRILRCYDVNRDGAYNLMYAKLKEAVIKK